MKRVEYVLATISILAVAIPLAYFVSRWNYYPTGNIAPDWMFNHHEVNLRLPCADSMSVIPDSSITLTIYDGDTTVSMPISTMRNMLSPTVDTILWMMPMADWLRIDSAIIITADTVMFISWEELHRLLPGNRDSTPDTAGKE